MNGYFCYADSKLFPLMRGHQRNCCACGESPAKKRHADMMIAAMTLKYRQAKYPNNTTLSIAIAFIFILNFKRRFAYYKESE